MVGKADREGCMKSFILAVCLFMLTAVNIYAKGPERAKIEKPSVEDVVGAFVDLGMTSAVSTALNLTARQSLVVGVGDIVVYALTGEFMGTTLVKNAVAPRTAKMMNYINLNGGWYGCTGKAAMALLDNSWEAARPSGIEPANQSYSRPRRPH